MDFGDNGDCGWILEIFIDNPSIVQEYYKRGIIRDTSESKFSLFVGNISFTQAESDIKKQFSYHCDIKNFKIINKTNRSGILIKRFAFVELFCEEDMEKLSKLDGSLLFGRRLVVKPASEKIV